jgi:glycosyltransferase involved in cell wall biosynthesis
MRIILSNYRYFISGGPERYLFAIKKILEEEGHQIFPFSVRSTKNEPSEYSDYFLAPIGSDNSTYFHEYKMNLRTASKIVARQFYSPEGFFKARGMTNRVDADLVYSLHFLNKMSPSVLDGFKSMGLPVIVRISDFSVICPQGHLFTDGKICEACISDGFFQAVKRHCVKKSLGGSFIKACAWGFHRILGSLERVDAWVFPSNFTRSKFIEAGMDDRKLHFLPTFIDAKACMPDFESQKYLLYFGRIVEEKGLHLLLKAYSRLTNNKPPLLIIGDRDDSDYSKTLVKQYNHEVKFLNFMPKAKLESYIKRALAVVIPSVWYDNLPNVLLEAYAWGKPVIAPNHGCFNDFVHHETTGLLYAPQNEDALAERLDWAWHNRASLKDYGKAARDYVLKYHAPEKHYEGLLALFRSLV